MSEHCEAFLQQTTEFWQLRTEHGFSKEDARVAIDNIAGFFDVLKRWAAATRGLPSVTKENTEVR